MVESSVLGQKIMSWTVPTNSLLVFFLRCVLVFFTTHSRFLNNRVYRYYVAFTKGLWRKDLEYKVFSFWSHVNSPSTYFFGYKNPVLILWDQRNIAHNSVLMQSYVFYLVLTDLEDFFSLLPNLISYLLPSETWEICLQLWGITSGAERCAWDA